MVQQQAVVRRWRFFGRKQAQIEEKFGRKVALLEDRNMRLETENTFMAECLTKQQDGALILAAVKDSVVTQFEERNEQLMEEVATLQLEVQTLRQEKESLRAKVKTEGDVDELKKELELEKEHHAQLSALIEVMRDDAKDKEFEIETLHKELHDWEVKLQVAEEFHDRDTSDLRKRIAQLSRRVADGGGGIGGADTCNTSVSSESNPHSETSFDSSLQSSPGEDLDSRTDLLEKIGELHKMVRSSVRHSFSPASPAHPPMSPTLLRVEHRAGPGLIFSPAKASSSSSSPSTLPPTEK